MSSRLLCTLAVATVVFQGEAQAQDRRLTQVDRIVAIVGKTVISYSRIEEELNIHRSRGGEFPADSAGRMALRQDILKRIIDDELLLQAAQRDTMVRVSEHLNGHTKTSKRLETP